MHETEIALSEFIRTGDIKFVETLRAAKIRQIELLLPTNNLMMIKIHLGLFKTEGLKIVGEREIELVILRINELQHLFGVHVKRPRTSGNVSPRLAARLRATFG